MKLLKEATRVRKNAYAPYSKFKVGAAIKTKSGDVFSGCNVENVAYPEGLCAEAGAVAAMCAAGQTEIVEVAVVADTPFPISMCGGCRQKISEFAHPDTPVTLSNLEGMTKKTTIGELIPGVFKPEYLPKT